MFRDMKRANLENEEGSGGHEERGGTWTLKTFPQQ